MISIYKNSFSVFKLPDDVIKTFLDYLPLRNRVSFLSLSKEATDLLSKVLVERFRELSEVERYRCALCYISRIISPISSKAECGLKLLDLFIRLNSKDRYFGEVLEKSILENNPFAVQRILDSDKDIHPHWLGKAFQLAIEKKEDLVVEKFLDSERPIDLDVLNKELRIAIEEGRDERAEKILDYLIKVGKPHSSFFQLAVEKGNYSLVLKVVDSGRNIDPSDLTKAFDLLIERKEFLIAEKILASNQEMDPWYLGQAIPIGKKDHQLMAQRILDSKRKISPESLGDALDSAIEENDDWLVEKILDSGREIDLAGLIESANLAAMNRNNYLLEKIAFFCKNSGFDELATEIQDFIDQKSGS